MVDAFDMALARLGSTKNRIVDIVTFAESPEYLGRSLYPRQREILREFFNGEKTYNELLLIAGRRSSKTFLTAVIAAYIAYLWQELPDPYTLLRGIVDRETPVYIITIATKPKQAKILLDEIKAKIRTSPYFKDKIAKDDNQFELWLTKNLIIEAVTSNSASEVGKTAIAVLFDELGKYGSEQGTRDGEEVYDTMSKSVGTFRGNQEELIKRCSDDPGLKCIVKALGLVVSISTPMAKQGILWRLFTRAGEIKTMLCYQLPTWDINPNFPRDSEYMRSEYSKNPRNFLREYGAQFSDAVDGMFPTELVDKCLSTTERKFDRIYHYASAIDTSIRRDAFAFAVGHLNDTGKVIIDLVRYWVPQKGAALDWHVIKQDIDGLCRTYLVETILHDQYQSEAVRLHFKNYSLDETTFTQPYKMEIYKTLEDLMHQGLVEFPDIDRLKRELTSLQRIWNGDRFSVHHPDSGPVTTDDGPDVVANLSYYLFKRHVREHDEDNDRDYGDDDLEDMVLVGGGGYH